LPLPCRNVTDDLTRPFGATDEQTTVNMFFRALCELGFGAKTSVGYGRFTEPEINKADVFLKQAEEDKERKKQEEERRRREEEDRLYPWRKSLSGLDALTEWGKFRQQFLDSALIGEHKEQPEVQQALAAALQRLRDHYRQNKKNWKPDWDAHLQSAWPSLAQSGDAAPQAAEMSIPSTDPAQQNRITAAQFKDFGDWSSRHQQLGLAIGNLPLPEAESLLKLFTQWKLDDKKAKPNKKTTWKALNAHIKTLQKSEA